MASGIEIQSDIVKGLVPELKNPDVFARSHYIAQETNPLLHFLHLAMMAELKRSSNYSQEALEAVNLGVESYEGLSVATVDPVPNSFSLSIIAEREKKLDFSMLMAEQMTEAREKLFETNYELALGVYAVSEAHSDSQELASTYSVGGAALIHSAHAEVYDFWQLEKELWPEIDA